MGGVLESSDFVLNDQYTFDNFVVGPCNRFAHAAAMGASETPGTYNPFFLHGSVGLGKTHLLQSICFSILDGWPESRILYLSCETFVNHFIHALQDGNLLEFRHKYRNVDVLVVDDIHLLANKERTQEEFFHTFNTLYNAGKQIVLSSDSPPIDIPTLQDRLVSRFKWGMVTEVEKPCFETRMAIVKRKGLRSAGTRCPDEVAKLIAERIEANVRELEGAVTRLIGYASADQAADHRRPRARRPARPVRPAARPTDDGRHRPRRHRALPGEARGPAVQEPHEQYRLPATGRDVPRAKDHASSPSGRSAASSAAATTRPCIYAIEKITRSSRRRTPRASSSSRACSRASRAPPDSPPRFPRRVRPRATPAAPARAPPALCGHPAGARRARSMPRELRGDRRRVRRGTTWPFSRVPDPTPGP